MSWEDLLGHMSAMHLSLAVLLLVAVPSAKSAGDATGHFEMYCDGVGFFLAKVDGAPKPGKLFLFFHTGFGGFSYVPANAWENVAIYRDGYTAALHCPVLARGRIQVDNEIPPYGQGVTRVSGKYDFELSGQHLQGRFAAKQRVNKHPPRICE